MKFNLTIDSENAAFSGSDGEAEVARLLKQTAERVEAGQDFGRLTDYNGNGCGSWDCEASPCETCGALPGETHPPACANYEEGST